ncbi:trehalose-6-phosphate phosphatase A [Hibiscus trionum]|uniref:Trehalose-6-phosphate phosphatase A n=1 Tax=Hibiscus trionum TaxID=183268 RepID=A0A9W7LT20_HIBTR|nr:trehalose-6-phosphate phosphatase A [Hibiscus trionum]
MDVKSNHTSVLTDPAPLSKSRLRVTFGLLQYSRAAFSPNLFLTVPRMETGIIDICASNCLDSMESSSPPHKKPGILSK